MSDPTPRAAAPTTTVPATAAPAASPGLRANLPGLSQNLSVTLTLWGGQDYQVDSHAGAAHQRYVLLRLGRVLLYVRDRLALESVIDIWVNAAEVADQLRLPARAPVSGFSPDRMDLAVSAHLTGQQVGRVLGLGAGASPNGHAQVAVTVGNLILRVYDRTALTSVSDALGAAQNASSVFGGGAETFAALRTARHRTAPGHH